MNNSDDDLVVRLGMVVEDVLHNPKGGEGKDWISDLG